jgi:squalene synthase HpnC
MLANVSVNHYENFPVASWLCPAHLRAPIAAIYWFARTADDIADEGELPEGERAQLLLDYRADLYRIAANEAPSPRWQNVFEPLRRAIAQHALPVNLLDDLLSAFIHDTANPSYADHAALLDYCRLSANPVGRLLLHLHGLTQAQQLQRADAICSALQLINFWQDLSVDLPRGRCYLPLDRCLAHGLPPDLRQGVVHGSAPGPQARALLAELCDKARSMMLEGAPLVHELPGRAGWELRLVVQGGLRILEKIAAMQDTSFVTRPVLGPLDSLPLLWRSLRMTRPVPDRGSL